MNLDNLSYEFSLFALSKKLKVVTAESCTAGLIAATIANTPGSSAWLDRGYIVYTPEAKTEMLGVKPETIKEFYITSEEVAKEMAIGALNVSKANFAMSVTGLAGPSGGTEEIPVGTVCVCWAWIDKDGNLKTETETFLFSGDRNKIREQAVMEILVKAMFML